MDSQPKRVGIIGAGVAGLLSIKCCLDEGLVPVCFEQHDQLGGTWYYTEHERKNQTASTYQNMHANDTKDRMAFSDFPVPDHYPPLWSVAQYYEYLMSYVQHFDLLRHIHFNQTVTKVRKADDYDTTGKWEVSTRSEDGSVEEKHVFDAISLCSGALTHGRIPDIPGLSDFKGKVLHSTQYRRPEDFAGQDVLVVGGRYSATDQACDITRQARQVYISLNRGLHVVPRTLHGRPTFLHLQRRRMLTSQENIGKGMMAVAAGYLNHAEHGLDTSQNPMLDGNNAVSDDFVPCLLMGTIKIRPGVESFTKDSVVYSDGTIQRIDTVLLATGYNTDYKFVECPDIQGDRPARFMLYKGVFPLSCSHPSLAVLCASGVVGSYVFHTDVAARWVTRVFTGKCELPPKKKMEQFTEQMRNHFLTKCGERIQISEFTLAEELASEIGVRPDLHRLIFIDPLLAYKVYYGPPIPSHYRLVGPGALQSARDYVHKFYDRLFPNDIPNKKRSFMWHGVLGALMAMGAFLVHANGSSIMEIISHHSE